VGDGRVADHVVSVLQSSPELGIDVVGQIADRSIDPVVIDLRPGQPLVTWLGPTSKVLELARSHEATTALVVADGRDTSDIDALVHQLTRDGLRVEVVTGLNEIGEWRASAGTLGSMGTMVVEPVPRHTWREPVKRMIDISISSIALLAASPVLVAAAIAVRLDSGPDVLFRQTRVGRDGCCFDVFKLRTMVADAEQQLDGLLRHNEAAGPMFKMSNDPRVTRIGQFLRSSSIDELPQLWNVLRGDMSLVGPRPALPREAAQWTDDLRERLRVRPGITGPWQVHGRFTATLEDYERFDVGYVDNWTLLGDFRLMALTVPAVLGRAGAV